MSRGQQQEQQPEKKETFIDKHRFKTRTEKIAMMLYYRRYGVNGEDGRSCFERMMCAFNLSDRDLNEYTGI